MKLEVSLMEAVEILSACESAIERETELMHKYEDTTPWRAKRHADSIKELQSVRQKIAMALQKGNQSCSN